MSNIKTFSNYNQDQRANQYAVGGSSGNLNSSGITQDNPYQPSNNSTGNSGVKTCFQIIFPKFSWKTFNFAIMIIDIIIFFVTIIVDSRLEPENSFTCVLYRFGAKYTPAITVYDHIHRLIVPIILHGGFAHLFFNMLSQAMYGFLLEDFYGHVKFIVLYIVSGIGGNLLSAAVNKTNTSVGASSALFGLLALNLSYILQNYDRFGPRRNLVLGLAIFNIVANLGTIADSSTIDGMAHLGGFLVGGLIAVIYYQRPTDKHFRLKKIVAGVLLLVYFLATFISVMTFKGLESYAYQMTGFCDYVFAQSK